MKPITFALMLLAQRVDESLRLARLSKRPDPALLHDLKQRKQRIGSRLRRSVSPMPAGS